MGDYNSFLSQNDKRNNVFSDDFDLHCRGDHRFQSFQNLPCYSEYRYQKAKKDWEKKRRSEIDDRSEYLTFQESTPPKKRWTVTYDNRNYIKSQMSKGTLEQLLAEKKKTKERSYLSLKKHKLEDDKVN